MLRRFLQDKQRCYVLHRLAVDYGRSPSDFLEQDIFSFSFDVNLWNHAKEFELSMKKGDNKDTKPLDENVVYVERNSEHALGW